MRSAEHQRAGSERSGAHARGVIRLAIGCFVALSAISMPLERVADALDSPRASDLVRASWVPDAPEPAEGATAPVKLPGAELDKDGSNKTKKVHSLAVAAIDEASAHCLAPASCLRRALEALRCRSAGARALRSARAPPRHA